MTVCRMTLSKVKVKVTTAWRDWLGEHHLFCVECDVKLELRLSQSLCSGLVYCHVLDHYIVMSVTPSGMILKGCDALRYHWSGIVLAILQAPCNTLYSCSGPLPGGAHATDIVLEDSTLSTGV